MFGYLLCKRWIYSELFFMLFASKKKENRDDPLNRPILPGLPIPQVIAVIIVWIPIGIAV